MTKGNYSLEVRSALENKGLLNTKLFLICGFVYHPLKNRSGHPMEYTFTQTFRSLTAICCGDLWISWTCWVVHAIVAIRPALGYILCFNMPQTSSKVTSPHGKSYWSFYFKPQQLVRGQMFQLCFFWSGSRLIIINTDTSFGFYCKNDSTLSVEWLL